MVWSILFPLLMQNSSGAHADPLLVKPQVAATQFVAAPIKPADVHFAPVATYAPRAVPGAVAYPAMPAFVAGARPPSSTGNGSGGLGQLFQAMPGIGNSIGSSMGNSGFGNANNTQQPTRQVYQEVVEEPRTESPTETAKPAETAKTANQKTPAEAASAAPAPGAPASSAPPGGAGSQSSAAPQAAPAERTNTQSAPASPGKNDVATAPPPAAPSESAKPEPARAAAQRPPPIENFPKCPRATSDPSVVDRMFKSLLNYDGIMQSTLKQDVESHGMRGLWNIQRVGKDTYVKISHQEVFAGKTLFCQIGNGVRAVIDISSASWRVRMYVGDNQIVTDLTPAGPSRIKTAKIDGSEPETFSTVGGGGGRAVAAAQDGAGAAR
jgi:hypothetical protein